LVFCFFQDSLDYLRNCWVLFLVHQIKFLAQPWIILCFILYIFDFHLLFSRIKIYRPRESTAANRSFHFLIDRTFTILNWPLPKWIICLKLNHMQQVYRVSAPDRNKSIICSIRFYKFFIWLLHLYTFYWGKIFPGFLINIRIRSIVPLPRFYQLK